MIVKSIIVGNSYEYSKLQIIQKYDYDSTIFRNKFLIPFQNLLFNNFIIISDQMIKESLYLSTYLDYLKLLESESVEQLIIQVLHLGKEEQQLLQQMRIQQGLKNCGQPLILNEYYIRCYDCGISDNHFYCQPCFDENQHLNHHIEMIRYDQGTGYCDCGDPNDIKPEGFCKKHSQIIVQNKINDRETELLGKIKVLLEILCFNAIRFLEYISKLPIIHAEEDLIQSSDSLKYIRL
ncbi:hypothetical protein pb186bvf_004765 [Paramecium bursaria]